MKFRYRARDRSGALRAGMVEAADREGALSTLRAGGLLVSHLEPVRLAFDWNAQMQLGARRVSTRDLALLCDQLASLIGAGVPILQALRVLAGQFRGRRLAGVLEQVVESVENGSSLSQAIQEHRSVLPPIMIYLTSVAEVSGRLEEAFALLARQFEQEEALARKVRGALAYPAVVLVVAFAVVVFMLTVVLPTYAAMFAELGAQLPLATRLLMTAGTWLQRFFYVPPVLLGAAWMAGRRLVRRPQVRAAVERTWLRAPVLGSLKYKRELARLGRTLATMSRSGVPLMAALLTIQSATEFLPLRDALAATRERVAGGESFAEALRAQPLFDPITVEMIALGEQAGTLDTMLFKVAQVADRDVAAGLQQLTAALEPVMTVVIGGVVVGLILPMLLPMFDLLGQIQ